MSLPLLTSVNHLYIRKILEWRDTCYTPVGFLQKINGFDQYNHLVDINAIFSTAPKGDIVDRTQTVTSPYKFFIQTPWTIPTSSLPFEQVMQRIVAEYLKQDQLLNLCWSGGIDSTSIIIAFLKHTPDHSRLRILYSPYSVYENRDFFDLLQKNYSHVEMLDISGDVYIKTHFDGHFVTGHGGDEFTASLDETFFNAVGENGLYQPWQDYFYKITSDDALVEFAESYFSQSGRPIKTLLDARWCYYTFAKSQIFAFRDNSFLLNQDSYSTTNVSGFFASPEFETYMYHNIDQSLDPSKGYLGYKQFIKEYIYQFDQNQPYYETKGKTNSGQFEWYTEKKIRLLDQRWIFKLSDDSVVRTKNLPFLSRMEFDKTYRDSLDYLFNSPQPILSKIGENYV